MTERSTTVESPFRRRHIQWTLATIVSIAVMVGFATTPLLDRKSTDANSCVGIEIELNQAEPHELSLVPGVGPVLADRIVANRRRLGDFRSLDDLLRVHGIGPRTLDQIAKVCVVDSPLDEQPTSDDPIASATE